MDLSIIKTEIRKYAKAAFSENNIVISDVELDDNIRLFFNFLTTPSGYGLLDGLASDMISGLQGALVDNIGRLTSLKSIATLFDAFAKKILVMSGLDTYGNVHDKTMMFLFKKMNIVVPVPVIDPTTIDSYKGRPSGLYIFGVSYLTRNNVHNSPNWDISDVVWRVRYVVALYILVIHNLKSILLSSHPEINQEKLYEYGNNKESQTAYDFISYSNPTNQLKNQVINSFIVHLLYNDGKQLLTTLVSRIINFSEGSITENAANRLIQNLFSKSILKYDESNKNFIDLSEEESTRVKTLIDDYNTSLSIFHSSIDQLLTDNNITLDKSELIRNFGVFFESNFNLDILEATDQEINKSSWNYYQELISFIKSGGVSDEVAEKLFVDILEICRKNDVIIRISAGRVFSKMSNPESFGNYVRSLSHDVYLDTQILLYVLCIHDDYAAFDNVFYRVAKNIVDLSQKNDRYVLKVSKHYLSEVVYQIKQALFLIQFTEIPNMPQNPISTNVFYRYFYWLRTNDLLPEETEDYRSFLLDLFNLEESDAFSKDFDVIAQGVIEGILTEDFGIIVDSTPSYDSAYLEQVQDLYRQVLRKNLLEEKSYKTLLNDSLECMVLFGKPYDEPEPFFLTWDKSFSFVRPEFKKFFKRGSTSLFFHLFSPAKFVNHVDLVDFKINTNTLSDDLLSLIESHNYKQTTYNVIDTINRFLDIPNISPAQRKVYIKKLQKNIYQDDIFKYEQTDVEQVGTTNKKSFAYIFHELFNYFKDKGPGCTKSYREMLLNEDSFDQFIIIVHDYMNTEDPSNDVTFVIRQVEDLVEKNSKITETSHPQEGL